ncbi:MAG TPA: cobyrinic acid a,c-diamide synthase, partial [Burkholderiaceae bacterium]|nr:cobyrinic acid a,c-diamide synthase [Burkholderiaceae bacterium]
DPQLTLSERHLGLMPDAELLDADARVRDIARAVKAQVDLDRVIALAESAAALPACGLRMAHSRAPGPSVRIGIARDRAFGFYYPDDLAALEAAGAVLVPFDTLRDARLPTVDGLFIGGGFPEMALAGLEANASLRADLRRAIAAGLPTYAECGGLMYLARSIRWGDRTAQMVGAIPGDVVMHERPVGRGYVQVTETRHFPWPTMAGAGTVRRGHEFHHSSLENLPPGTAFAYAVQRGHGIDGQHDGVLVHNLLASYTHLRHCAGNLWPQRFVAFVRQQQATAASAVCARASRVA